MKKSAMIIMIAILGFTGCTGIISGYKYQPQKVIYYAGKAIDVAALVVRKGKPIYASSYIQSKLSSSKKDKINSLYKEGKELYKIKNNIKALLKEEVDAVTVLEEKDGLYILSTVGGD